MIRLYFAGFNRYAAFNNGAFSTYEEALNYQYDDVCWGRVSFIYEVKVLPADLEEI
jgi:hypothetical protein